MSAKCSLYRRVLLNLLLSLVCITHFAPVSAQQQEYLLGTGDILKINVFKNPDLTTEVRVSEVGSINFPLIGTLQVRGLTLPGVERKIALMLQEGNFVLKPQVNALLTQAVSNQVAVLGQVNKPGRYSIEISGGNLSGILSAAGGIAPTGADIAIVTGIRAGKAFRREVDIVSMFLSGNMQEDIALEGGDAVFVGRAATFYVFGEVQHPGAYRLERDMTVMQALATGGGLTGKGTLRGITVLRKSSGAKVKETTLQLDETVKNEDVIYVKEGLF